MLTPQRVQLGPNADKELVIVVCTDEEGETHNHYIRDKSLRTQLKAEFEEHEVNAKLQRDSLTKALDVAHDTLMRDQKTARAAWQAEEKRQIDLLDAAVASSRRAIEAPVLARAVEELTPQD